MSDSYILVVPTQSLWDEGRGYFQGFCSEPDKYLDVVNKQAFFRRREPSEQEPEFKQLIPYVIIICEAANGDILIFKYRRGKGTGETRLTGQLSIGIGGHVDMVDDDNAPLNELYQKGMIRELNEEVKIKTTVLEEKCVGLINDDSMPVGKVHLGVVHVMKVAMPEVETADESEVDQAGFISLSLLRQIKYELETWSQIALDALFPE